MFACNGILFNHESPSRGETFVTRKITRAVAKVRYGLKEKLLIGNIDPKRDWGYAPEYVEVMWRILQQEEPDDYVLATGETHTVKEFADLAFKEVDMELEWVGNGIGEKGIEKRTGKTLVRVDPRYFRPTEVDTLLGDASKAKEKLGWEPEISFEEMVDEMVLEDLKLAQRDYMIKKAGFRAFDYNE